MCLSNSNEKTSVNAGVKNSNNKNNINYDWTVKMILWE